MVLLGVVEAGPKKRCVLLQREVVNRVPTLLRLPNQSDPEELGTSSNKFKRIYEVYLKLAH